MAAGDHDAATLAAYAAPRRASSTPAATAGATTPAPSPAASASATRTSTGSSPTFSGGEITRASLARALAGDPDLILLDEPTNHLDVASLEWLERELASLDAACIVVAHDRWFLEAVTNATLELEAGRATYFPGPGTSGASRRPSGRRTRRRPPTASPSTSRASSASWPASATRRTRPSRRRRS